MTGKNSEGREAWIGKHEQKLIAIIQHGKKQIKIKINK